MSIILFTEETTFYNNGQMKLSLLLYVNPHIVRYLDPRRWKVNVWEKFE